jgi:hypothetical protein
MTVPRVPQRQAVDQDGHDHCAAPRQTEMRMRLQEHGILVLLPGALLSRSTDAVELRTAQARF